MKHYVVNRSIALGLFTFLYFFFVITSMIAIHENVHIQQGYAFGSDYSEICYLGRSYEFNLTDNSKTLSGFGWVRYVSYFPHGDLEPATILPQSVWLIACLIVYAVVFGKIDTLLYGGDYMEPDHSVKTDGG